MDPGGLADKYLGALALSAKNVSKNTGPGHQQQDSGALLAECARAQHELGWFVVGVLVKLSLLGTVVGFILMLRSVGEVESFGVDDVQRILTLMSSGMSVALYTTLAGLISSIALAAQYLWADQIANRLVAVTVEYGQWRMATGAASP